MANDPIALAIGRPVDAGIPRRPFLQSFDKGEGVFAAHPLESREAEFLSARDPACKPGECLFGRIGDDAEMPEREPERAGLADFPAAGERLRLFRRLETEAAAFF